MDIAYSDRLAELILQARVGWAVAFVSLLLFAVLLVRLGRRISSSRFLRDNGMCREPFLLKMHRAESATASMEYLMVIVPFLVIVMTIWQLAFMLNAQTHVGYAVFAAARSAAVLIPAELDGEAEGKLVKQSGSKTTKWTRINRAAIPGTLAVSPGSFDNAFGVATANALTGRGFGTPQTPDATAGLARMTLMSMHMCDTPIFCTPQALTGTRPARMLVKNYYAQNMTRVVIEGSNSKSDLDLNGRDIIKVRVDYVFWMHVPYVGRMLQAAIRGWRNPLTGELIGVNPFPSIVLSEETSINTWFKKRATEPCD